MKQIVRDSIVGIVNEAIDMAVASEKYVLDMYSFLTSQKYKRNEVKEFLSSSIVGCITDEVTQLEIYLTGGPEAADLREVYGWMGKPRARKFKDYLSKILEDANRYEQEKNQEERKDQKLPINRGVELMLRRKKEDPPEQTGILFKKTIRILRRKINLTVEISKEV